MDLNASDNIPSILFSCYAKFKRIRASCFDKFVPSNTSICERAAGMCADVLDQGVILLMWDCK